MRMQMHTLGMMRGSLGGCRRAAAEAEAEPGAVAHPGSCRKMLAAVAAGVRGQSRAGLARWVGVPYDGCVRGQVRYVRPVRWVGRDGHARKRASLKEER